MKQFKLLLLFCFVAVNVFSQDATKKFDEKSLSEEEVANCKKFREMDGKDRYDIFNKIIHIFPKPDFTMIDNNTMSMEESSIVVHMSIEQLN